jgi:excisionase family DNA binding protein
MTALLEDKLLTVPEVADALRVSKFTIRNWLRAGRLAGYRPGGTKAGWLVRTSDVERFLAESRAMPNQDPRDVS